MSYASDLGLTPLVDVHEVLLRQVHPLQYLEGGKLSSKAFCPSEIDAGVMSTRREAIGADKACLDWLDTGHRSAGTWGVSVGDFQDSGIETVDDSNLPKQPQGHASADYTHLPSRMQLKKGRIIRDAAWERGPLYKNPAA